jgi:hypothetical protein
MEEGRTLVGLLGVEEIAETVFANQLVRIFNVFVGGERLYAKLAEKHISVVVG